MWNFKNHFCLNFVIFSSFVFKLYYLFIYLCPRWFRPVRLGSARLVVRAVPGQNRSGSPSGCPGLGRRRRWSGAAEEAPAGEEAPSPRCAPWAPPGRGARRAAWGRAASRWGSRSLRRGAPSAPGLWRVCPYRCWTHQGRAAVTSSPQGLRWVISFL